MAIRAKSWYLGALVGVTAGLLVATSMTAIDWRVNPSGLFHDENGTDWPIVAETAFSWFWPVAVVALVLTVIVHSWFAASEQN